MTSLKDLLNVMENGYGINIYIRDLSGIFSNPLCDIEPKNKSYHCTLHSFIGENSVCNACRESSLNHALISSEAYTRDCPCGMCEVVYPVVFGGKVRCILYAENVIKPTETVFETLEDFCNEDFDFSSAKSIVQKCIDIDDALKVLEVISSYIVLLLNNFSFAEEKTQEENAHWVVNNLIKHIENEYYKDINLKQMASLYGFNEKYIGRIFKSQTGMTFHEYLNSVRLNKAVELLETTEESVVKISKKCGFNNVTYFNRIFYKLYEKTPLEYRKSKTGRFWDKHSYLL